MRGKYFSFCMAVLFFAALTVKEMRAAERATCASQVNSQLDNWSANGIWSIQPPFEQGEEVTSVSLKQPGSWVEKHRDKNGKITLIRHGPGLTEKVSWEGPRCLRQVETKRQTLARGARTMHDEGKLFTDATLTQIFGSKRSLLLFAWSPHMPLSALGLKEIAEVGKKLNIEVLYLSESMLASQDLSRRGVGLHYPSLIVVRSGEIIGPIVPGYKTAEFYQNYLEKLKIEK